MLPDRRLLRVIARSVFLAVAIFSFPLLGSIMGSSDHNSRDYHALGAVDESFFVPVLFGDLSNLGLIRSGNRAAFVGEVGSLHAQVLEEMKMDLVSEFDTQLQKSIPDDTFDFVFADGFATVADFIERVLKTGGIMAVQMNDDVSGSFRVPPYYKIVYLRQFQATIVVMKKMGRPALQLQAPNEKRRLCGVASEAMKIAISGLEELLLEPPQLNSMEIYNFLGRVNYLPDLMGDSLDGYPRRIFVNLCLPGHAGGGDSGTGWFKQHYPTKSREFEIYNVEARWDSTPETAGASDWLWRNVREDEYVVAKADADVVEEMVKSRAICLVDELFLECKQQEQNGKVGKRAYWECLALLGHLRGEGIAVHQWWS